MRSLCVRFVPCSVPLLFTVLGVGCAPPPPAIPTLPPPPVRPVASAAMDEPPPALPAAKPAPDETAKKDDDSREPQLDSALSDVDPAGLLAALNGGADATKSGVLGKLSGSGGGVGVVGIGSVGTLGHGSGTGSGFGRLGGTAPGPTVTVRQGAVQVTGRLPLEVIQRIVRMNFGRMRLCYDTALRANPRLSGRASVRFLIGPSGAVQSAVPGPTDFAPAAMQSCLALAFRAMSFPTPEDGVAVTVVYPILFSSTPAPPAPPAPPPASAPPPPPPRARVPAPPPAKAPTPP